MTRPRGAAEYLSRYLWFNIYVITTKRHKKLQYLNVVNYETEKERKCVVFVSNNVIQEEKS